MLFRSPGSIPVLADSGELIAGDLIAGPFLGAVRHRPANPRFRHDRTLNLASLDAVLALDPAVGVRRPWGAAGAVAPTTLGKKRTPQTRSSANNVNLTADQSEKSPWF